MTRVIHLLAIAFFVVAPIHNVIGTGNLLAFAVGALIAATMWAGYEFAELISEYDENMWEDYP